MTDDSLYKIVQSFTGRDKWQIADEDEGVITSADGPHGLRIEKTGQLGFPESHQAVAYPAACASACCFDRGMVREMAESLAADCIHERIQILLGPGINHKRDPLCGRNFEYFSEDPVLSGELAAAYISGLQEHGIACSLKHFACNNREYMRNIADSTVDERTLREIYLRAFEIAVRKAKPWTMMMAYNRLNGNYCCENEYLMKLARSWGFDGAFISDWGGVSDPVASVKHGLNVIMPGSDHGVSRRLMEAAAEETISRSQLLESNAYVRKLIRRTSEPKKAIRYDADEQHANALRVAENSIVLAKNNGILPLKKTMKAALIGEPVRSPYHQGYGSSRVNTMREHTMHDCLHSRGIHFFYSVGTDREYSLKIAGMSDVTIVIAAQEEKESETYDRRNMKLPDHINGLITELCSGEKPVVVIVQSGSPVEMPWLNEADAVILSYLTGSMGADAMAEILYGDICPSGRLAETWPLRYEDTPCAHQDPKAKVIPYTEMIYTGYRWYDTLQIPVAFPFGHGLSYTEFEWSDMRAQKTDKGIEVSLSIRNTGSRKGRETVQFYVSVPDSRIARPAKELKDFASVTLEPGEEKTVSVCIADDRLAYYDVRKNAWMIEAGEYRILAGASVSDIRCKVSVQVDGITDPYSRIPEADRTVLRDEKAFEKVLGRSLPRFSDDRPYDADSVILDFANTKAGRLAIRTIDYLFDHTDLVEGIDRETVYTTPLRQMVMVSDRMTWDTVDGITDMLNGRYVKGLRKVLKSLKK